MIILNDIHQRDNIFHQLPSLSSSEEEKGEEEEEEENFNEITLHRRAQIIYTSGTTGRPKGVVITHKNIESQVIALTNSWEWSSNDYILNVLPLHHIHGIINVLTCCLFSGGTIEMLEKFDSHQVWNIFIQNYKTWKTNQEINKISRNEKFLSLFMAVPTIYGNIKEKKYFIFKFNFNSFFLYSSINQRI